MFHDERTIFTLSEMQRKPGYFIMPFVLCRSADQASMIGNGWMLKELSDADCVRVKVECRFVTMIELHEKQRVTADAEDARTGRNSTAVKNFTP
jgi:hypothetical protein